MKPIYIILLSFFLVSCSGQPLVNSFANPPAHQQAATQDSGYPPAASQKITAYPAVNEKIIAYPAPAGTDAVTPVPLPTRNSSLASIKGRLLQNGKPLENADLYLSNLLVNDQGKEVAFTFDSSKSPRTLTNQNGEFEFFNLQPGQYGLVYDVVVQSVLLLDPKSGKQMKYVLAVGQSINAGDLDYSDLPNP